MSQDLADDNMGDMTDSRLLSLAGGLFVGDAQRYQAGSGRLAVLRLLHRRQRLPRSPRRTKSDSKETMATRGRSSSSHTDRAGNGFYNLPSATKRKDWWYPVASSVSPKLTDRVSAGGNVTRRPPLGGVVTFPLRH